MTRFQVALHVDTIPPPVSDVEFKPQELIPRRRPEAKIISEPSPDDAPVDEAQPAVIVDRRGAPIDGSHVAPADGAALAPTAAPFDARADAAHPAPIGALVDVAQLADAATLGRLADPGLPEPRDTVPMLAAQDQQRTPGSAIVLPANPLQDLSDESIEGFIDCTLYEETENIFHPAEDGPEWDDATAESASPAAEFAPVPPVVPVMPFDATPNLSVRAMGESESLTVGPEDPSLTRTASGELGGGTVTKMVDDDSPSPRSDEMASPATVEIDEALSQTRTMSGELWSETVRKRAQGGSPRTQPRPGTPLPRPASNVPLDLGEGPDPASWFDSVSLPYGAALSAPYGATLGPSSAMSAQMANEAGAADDAETGDPNEPAMLRSAPSDDVFDPPLDETLRGRPRRPASDPVMGPPPPASIDPATGSPMRAMTPPVGVPMTAPIRPAMGPPMGAPTDYAMGPPMSAPADYAMGSPMGAMTPPVGPPMEYAMGPPMGAMPPPVGPPMDYAMGPPMGMPPPVGLPMGAPSPLGLPMGAPVDYAAGPPMGAPIDPAHAMVLPMGGPPMGAPIDPAHAMAMGYPTPSGDHGEAGPLGAAYSPVESAQYPRYSAADLVMLPAPRTARIAAAAWQPRALIGATVVVAILLAFGLARVIRGRDRGPDPVAATGSPARAAAPSTRAAPQPVAAPTPPAPGASAAVPTAPTAPGAAPTAPGTSPTAPGTAATAPGAARAAPATPPTTAAAAGSDDPAETESGAADAVPDEDGEAAAGGTPVVGSGPCRFTVATTPAGSIVRLDDQAMGPSPITIESSCDKHKVDISHARYQPVTKWLTLAADQPQTLDISLPRPIHAVTVTSFPPGAELSIDGHRAGTTPTVVQMTGFATVNLTFTKAGFQTVTKKVYSKVAQDRVFVKLMK